MASEQILVAIAISTLSIAYLAINTPEEYGLIRFFNYLLVYLMIFVDFLIGITLLPDGDAKTIMAHFTNTFGMAYYAVFGLFVILFFWQIYRHLLKEDGIR